MKDFIKYNWPSILWAAFILVICLLPPGGIPKVKIPNLDKAVHFFGHAVLGFLLFYGWLKQNAFSWPKQNTVVKIIALVALYGLAIEVLQSYVGRDFSWWDETMNVLGGIAGIFIFTKLFTPKITPMPFRVLLLAFFLSFTGISQAQFTHFYFDWRSVTFNKDTVDAGDTLQVTFKAVNTYASPANSDFSYRLHLAFDFWEDGNLFNQNQVRLSNPYDSTYLNLLHGDSVTISVKVPVPDTISGEYNTSMYAANYQYTDTIIASDTSLFKKIYVRNSLMSLRDNTELRAAVYPNPTTGFLFIQPGNVKPLIINIYNVEGRKVFTQPYKTQLDINHLINGLYFIELKSEKGASRQRFMKIIAN